MIELTRRHLPSGSESTRVLSAEDLRAEWDRNRHRFIGRDSERCPSPVFWGAWLANHWTGGDWVYTARLAPAAPSEPPPRHCRACSYVGPCTTCPHCVRPTAPGIG